jgi:hypothetical protein
MRRYAPLDHTHSDLAATWGGITGTLSDQTDLNTALGLKANDADVVKLTGDQSIAGLKTFTNDRLLVEGHASSAAGIYSGDAWSEVYQYVYGGYNYGGAFLTGYKRGTKASPLPVEAGDILGWFAYTAEGSTGEQWPLYKEFTVDSRSGNTIYGTYRMKRGGGTTLFSLNSANGNVAWLGELTGGTVPWARLSGVPDYLPLSGGTLTGGLQMPQGSGHSVHRTVLHPQGGSHRSNSATQAGAVKITLPTLYPNTMMRMRVECYTYTGESVTYYIEGYHYASASTWANARAMALGPASSIKKVRFGDDGSKSCIWIGEVGDSSSYPYVVVAEVMCAHGSPDSYASGWEVGFVTSFDTVKATIDATQFLEAPPGVASMASTGAFTVNKAGNASSFIRLDPTGPSSNYSMTIGQDDTGAYISHSSTIRGFRYIRGGTTHFNISSAGAVTLYGTVAPSANITYDLGAGSAYWRDLFTLRAQIGSSDNTLSRKGAGSLGVEDRAAVVMANTAYVQSRITVSTSAPSGGVNGDIWLKV